MKTVTIEEIISWKPCWLAEENGEKRLRKLFASKTNWSSLDILAFEDVSVDYKFWTVLRTELIDEMVLHEFACRCAETALALIDNPNHWARSEARSAASLASMSTARSTASSAANSAARSATSSADWSANWSATYDAARSAQATMLIKLIKDGEKSCLTKIK